MMRWALIALALFCTPASAQLGTLPYSGGASGMTWAPVRIDGGGFVTNAQIACDQGVGACAGTGTATKIVRTDTAGAWVWAGGCVATAAVPCWQPVLTIGKFPDHVIGTSSGVCEVAISPSNTNHLYVYYTINVGDLISNEDGFIYESTNKGASWVRTSSAFNIPCDANEQSAQSARLKAPYMAVDPVADSVALLGTPASGIYKTTNGGSGASTAWAAIPVSSVPAGFTVVTAGSPISATTSAVTGSLPSCFGAGWCQTVRATNVGAIDAFCKLGASATVAAKKVPAGGFTAYVTANFWTQMTCITASGSTTINIDGGTGYGNLIAYDPSSAVVGGKTQGIFATAQGSGVYHSTDGGANWTPLNTTGMPTTFQNMKVAPNGNLWIVDGSSGNNTGNTWLWTAGGGWVKKTTNQNLSEVSSVAINPADPTKIYAIDYHGYLNISTDSGATFPTISASFTGVSSAIPWLQAIYPGEGTVAITTVEFDPSATNTMWGASGIGVFTINPGTTNAQAVWDGNATLGIQNVDTTVGVSFVGGPPFLANQDRNTWIVSNPALPQSANYPFLRRNNTWGGIGAVLTNTSFWFLSDAINGTSFSTNSGANWTVLSSLPANEVPNGASALAKTMTAYSLTSAIMMLSNSQGPYCLTGGALNSSPVWSDCTFANGAVRADVGWGGNQFNSFTSLAMDQVAVSTYCMYSDGTGAGTNPAGFYKSTNGTSFGYTAGPGTAGRLDGTLTGFFTIASVPGHAANYFAANLAYIHNTLPNTGIGLWRTTTDCNGTWAQLPNVQSVIQFSVGAVCPGGSGYPSVYVVGWVNQGSGYQYGIYRSDNADQASPAWVLIGDGYPAGNFDLIQFITADVNTCGTVYGGFANSGFFYGKLNFLLKRDLDPAANDNQPMFLSKMA